MLRDHAYLVMMGACLLLFISAWSFVRLYSVTAAIVMSCVALVIPLLAAIVANAGDEDSRRRR
jgi:ABC-type transport system involved in cytochrome bd biosynthesis fused ATPase/permease subunit